MDHVYFTVITRDARQSVQAYLYAHSEIVGEVLTSPTGSDGGRRHLLVQTTADTLDRARYLGKYQADRLASGLHSPSQVHDLESDAVIQHRERWGVTVQREDYAQS